ncbi:protein arginine kinase [Ferroacidibacillus organovorans]|uniref:Protein-arginine kinase n=1 Tax=Ferroacidibacillus organovorans TaxID=1765683 RepID=A0A101XPQ7_9BACL|nr:protein arginine kinase [Ferroacidibacillus organovorans]KUO95122.1 ATP--guanido phosphotransferase [Ferroacidibacillus organovorans]
MSLEDYLAQNSATWLKDDGPESDIVISSRVRIARNLRGRVFPMLATDQDKQEILEAAARAAKHGALSRLGPFEMFAMRDLSEVDQQVLVEKHLISPGLIESSGGAVLLRPDEEVSIMVNEEDHLRIQCLLPGYQLETTYRLADQLDDGLEEMVDYAFDEEKGYLTACPTNVGTGMRASIMMHLPVLVMTGHINRILSAVTHVGLAVRGIYGEGSDALGNLFQISNQITLGQTEQEIIGNLHGVARQLINHERTARQHLLQANRVLLEDRVCRSFGILAYARQIDSKEALSRLSDVRLGIDLGVIRGVSAGILKELMVATQPGSLQKSAGHTMTAEERDVRRAALIRDRLRADPSSSLS